jgi:enoyl-CoA hydratase/carnithine racemase
VSAHFVLLFHPHTLEKPVPSIRREDDYLIITLHDEGKFQPETYDKVKALLDEAEADESAKALIIEGQGKNFSQGYDLAWFQANDPKGFSAFTAKSMLIIKQILSFPIPTVAAVNGHAFGFGAFLVLASDYSVQRLGVGFFCLPEVNIGLPFAPSMNELARTKLPNRQVIRDAMYTGKRYPAEESAALGIVDATAEGDDLIAAAKALAEPAVGRERRNLSVIKTAVNKEIIAEIDRSQDEPTDLAMPG